jgi:hypothetical protein
MRCVDGMKRVNKKGEEEEVKREEDEAGRGRRGKEKREGE